MPDTTPTPADNLRAAALILRQAANSAGAARWTADHFPEGTIVRPEGKTRSLFVLAADGARAAGTPCVPPPIGAHMALMGPTLGLALADWLDAAAGCLSGPDTVSPHALAVARLVLGTTDQPPTPPAEACTEHGAACHTREWPAPGAVTDVPAEVEQLRTENARMRHELEVMYGGAFDKPRSTRLAVLAECDAIEADYRDQRDDVAVGARAAVMRIRARATLRRMADEAQQPQTSPCGPTPDVCDAEAGDPCANHEREQAHSEGEHAFCGSGCPAAADRPDTETEAAK